MEDRFVPPGPRIREKKGAEKLLTTVEILLWKLEQIRNFQKFS